MYRIIRFWSYISVLMLKFLEKLRNGFLLIIANLVTHRFPPKICSSQAFYYLPL